MCGALGARSEVDIVNLSNVARGILKSDNSCISNPKSQIGPQSNLQFQISDLRCRNCPISKFPRIGSRFDKYVDALREEGNANSYVYYFRRLLYRLYDPFCTDPEFAAYGSDSFASARLQ